MDFTAMTDLDDHDDKIQTLNFVQDSIVPLSKSILLAP